MIFSNKCNTFQNITCGVPQGSILGPLSLLFVNDLPNISKLLDPMFAENANLFFCIIAISKLFLIESVMNSERLGSGS